MTDLQPGEFAPMFVTASTVNPAFRLETAGGRRIALSFLGSFRMKGPRSALASLVAQSTALAAHRTFVFPISADMRDADTEEARQLAQPYTIFWDFSLAIAKLYQMTARAEEVTEATLKLGTVILDENQRFLAFVPLDEPDRHGESVLAIITGLPDRGPPRRIVRQAPVLIIPNVLPTEYCRFLIEAYDAHGGKDSGYMQDRAGNTVGVIDYHHKRRSDWFVGDESIQASLAAAIMARVVPEIRKAFQYEVTHVERYLIARYDSATADHFRPHRDDNAEATAHRRFAMTVNLNAGDYEGGDLRFPEYGLDTYRVETGDATVFSCTLMHEVLPVTAGRRYAFLPFLYDDAAARQLDAYLASRRG